MAFVVGLLCLPAFAQTPVRYWFDKDCAGVIDDTMVTNTMSLQVDVSNLSEGFHTVNFIIKDTAGRWLYPTNRYFYRIPDTITGKPTFWFDRRLIVQEDTLYGNVMDVSDLSVGFHTIYIKFGTELWSRLFYRIPTGENIDSVCSYWFDKNAGDIRTSGITGGNVLFNLDGLEAGFHTLRIKVGEELRYALFYKIPDKDTVSYSYWFDGIDSSKVAAQTGMGIAMLDVESLSDTFHTVYLVVEKGNTTQLHSYTFEKVPLMYSVTLAVDDSTRGTVSGAGDYPRNSTVSISATAEYGYHFSMWSDGDTNALRSIYLTQDTSLIAYFVPDTFQFDITVGDTSMGTVVVTGTSEYLGTDTATAIPNYGYHFTGWSDGDTSNPRLVILTQDTTLTATFAPNIYTVTLLTDTPEWGSVIGAGEYPYLTTVPLEAVATYGYQFKQWNDADQSILSTDNPLQLVVRGDTTLTATFELLRYTLTVQSNDLARGFTQGGGTFTVMDTATALAITLAGNSFLGWADGDMTNPRQLQLSSDTTLTAIFQALNSMPETIIVHDTTVVTDTLTLTLHDTTYIDIPVHDTTVLVDTLLVDHYIYDTIDNYIYVTDTVTMTEYVPIHDTTYIDVPVHDTTIVTLTNTVVNTVYDTVDNYIYDTTIVTDTLWLTLYDTVWMTDTVYIHDTVYVPENGIDEVATTNIRLYQRDGQIVVEDADGGVLPEVVVYDAVGRKMETGFAGGAPAYQFEVPASGVYLVKIGDRPARRIVVIR